MLRFSCPFCHYKIESANENASGKILCPACEKTIALPNSRFEEGCIIGDFILQRKIGSGSSGMVFLAQQISLERDVALKIMPRESNPTAMGDSSFLNEARAAAKLCHTNLVQAYAVGEDDGLSYMAMTYIHGETLKARLKRELFIPVDEALHITQQIAEALSYAWEESKLIHRDVKPDNIMLTTDGIAKLTDLGLAMYAQEWYEGMPISGSPSYMSPEQFTKKKLDTRSDIYSLGITLYQMITGVLPFRAAGVPMLAQQHLHAKPDPLEKYIQNVPQKVSALVWKMMEKKPERRFQNMDELLNAIWAVRQITAPNRSYVPTVHTISIQRLNYKLQNDYLKNIKKQNSESGVSSKSNNMVLISLVFMLLSFVGVFGFLWINHRIFSGNEPFSENIDAFERLVENQDIPYSRLKEEANYLISELDGSSKLKSQYKKYLISHVKYQLSRREIPVSATATASALLNQEHINELKNQLELTKLELLKYKDSQIPELLSIVRNNNQEIDSLKSDLDLQVSENKKLQSQILNTIEETNRLKELNQTQTKNAIRRRVFQLLSSQRFSSATQLLKSEGIANKELEAWCSNSIKLIETLDGIYNALKQQNESVVNLELIEPSYVETTYRKTYPDSQITRNSLLGAFEVMKGNLKKASEYLPEEEEIILIAEAIADDLVDAARTAQSAGVKKIPSYFQNMFDKLPKTKHVTRCASDINQLFGVLNK